jgi:hypothetical protein
MSRSVTESDTESETVKCQQMIDESESESPQVVRAVMYSLVIAILLIEK